tara:strand:- start:145 stop:498 length:354 start_codon:yes stop_codon:yes gene_type:complete
MDHKEMDVWKQSMELVEVIYKISARFPKEEMYGLTSQIRRAVVSIPSNIAEGAARKSDKEFLQFISIAMGSLSEVDTQYLLSVRLGFVHESKSITNLIRTVAKLLIGTKNYLIRKQV